MVDIYPFKALRPIPDKAEQIASVPYDVISREEGVALVKENPDSFLHINRPDISFPQEIPAEDPQVYQKGKEQLERMIKENLFIEEKEKSLYLYQLKRGEHQQIGLVCCASIQDYEEDRIKKHEKTRKDKEADRIQHIRVLETHDEPCFLFYKTNTEIQELTNQALQNNVPLYDFTAEDGVQHTLYPLAQPELFVQAFAKIPDLYVADGHHRTHAAFLLGKELAQTQKEKSSTSSFESDRFLTVLFPQEQLQILAYNRIIKTFEGLDPESFYPQFEKIFPKVDSPLKKGFFRIYWNHQWSTHQIPTSLYGQSAVEKLDVAVLQRELFDKIIGIKDPRTDSRIHFIGAGEEKIASQVDQKNYQLGISLFPVAIEELIEIADGGEILPPKSTWFEPKLRSGLFLHPFKSSS